MGRELSNFALITAKQLCPLNKLFGQLTLCSISVIKFLVLKLVQYERSFTNGTYISGTSKCISAEILNHFFLYNFKVLLEKLLTQNFIENLPLMLGTYNRKTVLFSVTRKVFYFASNDCKWNKFSLP